jgi:hypothetical protein
MNNIYLFIYNESTKKTYANLEKIYDIYLK